MSDVHQLTRVCRAQSGVIGKPCLNFRSENLSNTKIFSIRNTKVFSSQLLRILDHANKFFFVQVLEKDFPFTDAQFWVIVLLLLNCKMCTKFMDPSGFVVVVKFFGNL